MILGLDFDTYAVYPCLIGFDFETQPGPDGPSGYLAARFPEPLRIRRAADSGEYALWRALPALARRLALPDRSGWWDGVRLVWIERGFGMSRSADYLLGAVFGALLAAIPTVGAPDPLPIDLREWKKAVLPKAVARGGNVKKAVVHEYLRAAYPHLLASLDGNQVDAFGIALAGLRLNARAVGRAS